MKYILRHITLLSLYGFTISFFSTCQKEYSYENGSSKALANYSIICANSNVLGNYYVAKNVDNTNKLQVQVDVSAIGVYQISTNTANGFSFSVSGSFTTIGLQTITLTAIGKPIAIGNYNFSINRNGITCSFMINVQNAPVRNAIYTLAGAPLSCDTPNISGFYIIGTPLGLNNSVKLKINVIDTGAYLIRTDTVNGIYFSGAGNFTNMGIQYVDLFGTGIPILPRNAVFTPQIAGPRCSFVVPNVQPGPYAEYVLESAALPNYPCLYTINGNYVANTTLINSNTVSIQIFVVQLGSYAVATNTLNGIQFSKSGVFTNMGAQTLILEGSGTPTVAGTFMFKPEIVGASPLGGAFCTFELPVR